MAPPPPSPSYGNALHLHRDKLTPPPSPHSQSHSQHNSHSGSYHGYGNHRRPHPEHDGVSVAEELLAGFVSWSHLLWTWAKGPGRRTATIMALRFARQVRRNLTVARLFNFPHALVLIWVIILLWGERWVFEAKVESCAWENWEKWPSDAQPHHLVFVADPQLIDPHSYPGRPWPLSALTVLITDNYLRRSYRELTAQLEPDSLFFLGDLFDGGREWKTAHGDFHDPKWAEGHRPANEQKYVASWNRKYGEDFWLREYKRFGDIFFTPFAALESSTLGAWQRGRKLVASLPGNHDLGFGSEVKISVRDRFSAYFGEGNRVEVVGNHTIVSVDTVSLSADSASIADEVDLRPIYMASELFLKEVSILKRKAVAKELRFWRGEPEELPFPHRVEELHDVDLSDLPDQDPGKRAVADLPTILLTHVPLYRDPGTPCGPMRERHPPTQPPKGQTGPVIPDHRNAISVSSGYQYQNVLGDTDSQKLVRSVGNVVHVFSGDDHDYCELVHAESRGNVKEITVKSISMAMGVRHPGFVMVSMYHPIDANDGEPLAYAPEQTLQTHLCLLPDQLSTYAKYGVFILVSIILLTIRAFLVPLLRLPHFALEPELSSPSGVLPVFKDKVDDGADSLAPPYASRRGHISSSSGSSSSRYLSSRFGSAVSSTRTRSPSESNGQLSHSPSNGVPSRSGSMKHKYGKTGGAKWGWGEARAPKIEIESDDFYDGGKKRSASSSFHWKAANRGPSSSRSMMGIVGRELWTTVWRVAWMVVLFWAYLAYKG